MTLYALFVQLQAVCALGGVPDHMNEKRKRVFVGLCHASVAVSLLLLFWITLR